ncbi:MAG: PAS domain S-box protein [Thermus sp.]|nr:PAS domain S-box protein [Thermus sp.]
MRLNPLGITLLYALFSLLWVLGSDQLLLLFAQDVQSLTRWQSLKGGGFLLLSSLVVYLLAKGLESTTQSANETLRASEKRFRTLVENGRELVYVIDQEGRIRYASPNVKPILGYNPVGYTREAISILSYVHPEDRIHAEAALEDLLHHPGATREYSLRILDEKDKVRSVRVWGRNLLHDPSVQGIVLNVRDETEEVRLKEDLETQRHLFQNLLETLPGVPWQVQISPGIDPLRAPILYLGPQARRSGYPLEAFPQNPEIYLKNIHPEDLDVVREAFQKAIAQPATVQKAIFRFRLDENRQSRWLWLEHSLYYDGETQRLTGYTQDVTREVEAHQLLEAQEERFRLLFQAHPLPMWIYEPETLRFLEVNQAAVDKYGYTREEFLTMTILDIRPERERIRLLQDLQSPRPPLQHSGPWIHRLKDGREIWVEIYSHALPDGHPPKVLVVALDITQRLQTEASMRLLQNALEAAHEAVVLTDRSGRIEWVNAAFTRLTGYTPGEALGQNPRILKSGVQDQAFYKNLWATILSGKVWKGEIVNRRKDGTLYTEYMTITPVREDGEIRHFIAIKRDITKEKARERALRESETLFRSLAETAPALILLWQEERLTFVNKEALRLTGYTREELSAHPIWEFVHPADRAMVRERGLARIRGESPPSRYRFRILTKEGEVRWLDYSAVRVEIGGKPAVLGVGLDITEAQEQALALEAFARVSLALRHSEELKEMMEAGLKAILSALEAHAGSILLYDADTGRLEEAASRGWLKEIPTPATLQEEGLVTRAFRGEVVVSLDLKKDPRVRPGARSLVPAGWSGVVAPLLAGKEPVGALTVAWPHPRTPTPPEVERILLLAEALGNAVRRASLRRKLARRVEQLEALRAVDQAIVASLELEPTLEIFFNQVMRLSLDAAGLFLYHPKEKTLELCVLRGFYTPKRMVPRRILLGQGHVGKAALTGEVVFVPDLAQDPGAEPGFTLKEGLVAQKAYPLFAKGRLLGVLTAFTRKPWNLSPEEEEFLESLVSQGAVALDNALTLQELLKSQRELEAAYDLTLWGWARAVELRDQETAGHTERVTELAVRLSKALGVPEEDLEHIRRGAILHDVGKIGIPDSILLKPGPLTEEEWAIMKKHPVYAYEWLSGIPFLKKALEIPYAHHERWDGSGYPRGLKGLEIPLFARIFAVVDVYDALTSDRPYRKAWPKEKALAYLREQAGKGLDPEVVVTFLRILEEEDPF